MEEGVVPEVPVTAGGGEDHTGQTEVSGHPSHLGLTTGSNPVSPIGSRTSGTTLVSAVFQRKKRRLLEDLEELQSTPQWQPDTLKLKVSMLKQDLKDLEVNKIMEKYKSDPNFLDHFGANTDDLMLWMEETELQLRELELIYLDQIAVRKSFTQSEEVSNIC